MKKMKKIIIILFAAMSSLYVSAQAIHEFSIYGSGGFSTLSYQLSQGDKSGGVGGDFGVGYTFFLSKERVTETGKILRQNWGIHTGLGIGLYNAKAKLNNVETITEKLDDGEAIYSEFDLYTTLSGYNETQKAVFLNIPVMACFQMEQIYFMGGLKFGIPIGGKYESKDATLTNKAYYKDLDVWLDSPKFAGYGKFTNSSDGKLKQDVTIMLSLETGWNWYINDHFSLYTGLYFDLGLNNVYKNNKNSFINFDMKNPKDFTTNSVLSSYQDDKVLSVFSEKVKVMAIGVKVRLAFSK